MIKPHVFTALARSGVSRWVGGTRWRRHRLLILCYHGLALDQEHRWRPALYFRPAEFEARLRLLRELGASVLPLGEALAHLKAGTLPPRSVVLTFDDGNYDFYRLAFPLLTTYALPATVYLRTSHCGVPYPIFKLMLSYLLWLGRGGRYAFEDGGALSGVLDLTTPAATSAAEVRLEQHIREHYHSIEDRNEILHQLAKVLGIDYKELLRRRVLQLMNPDEVAEVAAGGVGIELHTHWHTTPDSRDLLRDELGVNRGIIQAATGISPTHFCYPSGYYRPELVTWLRGEPVDSATTCDPGLASRGSDPLLLPRLVDMASITPAHFACWVTGTAAIVPHRRPGPRPLA